VLYCTPADVGSVLNTTFTDTTSPTFSLVTDMIARQDSWIDEVSGHNWLVNQSTEEPYDAIGSGPRAGMILLRKRPVLSVQKVEYWDGGVKAWIPGMQGYPEETASAPLVSAPGGLSPRQVDSFYVYPNEGQIVWSKLRFDSRLRYRVSYSWGYPTVPEFIRDLSATLTAREIVLYWAGQFAVAEEISKWKERVDEKIRRLIFQAARRQPMAAYT
jgi:hypothetical protein